MLWSTADGKIKTFGDVENLLATVNEFICKCRLGTACGYGFIVCLPLYDFFIHSREIPEKEHIVFVLIMQEVDFTGNN